MSPVRDVKQPHIIEVDYNRRDISGTMLRARVPVIWDVKRGDPVIAYQSQDRTECDAVVARVIDIGPDAPRSVVEGRWTRWHTVYLDVDEGSVRDMHACPTSCDEDCDDYCHEGHEVPWHREVGHPCMRAVNGVVVGSYP